MKAIVVFMFLLCGAMEVSAQRDTSYATMRYDSVVIYHYNKGSHENEIAIVEHGRLNTQEVIKSDKLDQANAVRLGSLLMQRGSYGAVEAGCYDPHLGIVYWRGGRPAQYVSVCLRCNRLRPSLTIPAQRQGDRYGDYYNMQGMSDSFKKYLTDMVARYLK